MGDFGPHVERMMNLDGSIYEKIIYPDGHAEARTIPSRFSSCSSIMDTRVYNPHAWTDRL